MNIIGNVVVALIAIGLLALIVVVNVKAQRIWATMTQAERDDEDEEMQIW